MFEQQLKYSYTKPPTQVKSCAAAQNSSYGKCRKDFSHLTGQRNVFASKIQPIQPANKLDKTQQIYQIRGPPYISHFAEIAELSSVKEWSSLSTLLGANQFSRMMNDLIPIGGLTHHRTTPMKLSSNQAHCLSLEGLQKIPENVPQLQRYVDHRRTKEALSEEAHFMRIT
ncbi:uncharacterized protein LOC129748147 [Uranotaenia lowii]|uniref:uncharacterized protein LOC129743748 n=1 Tax=Uranotaenia lowii TaxID=190385 RepID=UPI002478DCBF|nr:uncharacterized protein LOC129743748 [Uranotaenia lowii]XP_055598626.1 uncharacterized protein LOC129748147 [Uranotaenia lowii]